jgi:hypothetical protein
MEHMVIHEMDNIDSVSCFGLFIDFVFLNLIVCAHNIHNFLGSILNIFEDDSLAHSDFHNIFEFFGLMLRILQEPSSINKLLVLI